MCLLYYLAGTLFYICCHGSNLSHHVTPELNICNFLKCLAFSLITVLSARVNSTILANTLKNKRKAEKKKRALERRMSEGDACSLEQANDKVDKVDKGKMSTSSSLDLNMVINNKDQWESEEHEDSGLASSFEEHLVLTGDNAAPGKTKAKKMTKKRSKQFVMSNELIFDLDI